MFEKIPIADIMEGFLNNISDIETIEIINDLGGFDAVIDAIKKEIDKINPYNEKAIDLKLMLLKRVIDLKN